MWHEEKLKKVVNSTPRKMKTEEDEFHWLTGQYKPVQCSCKKTNWIIYWVTSTLRFKSNDSDWISIKIPSSLWHKRGLVSVGKNLLIKLFVTFNKKRAPLN